MNLTGQVGDADGLGRGGGGGHSGGGGGGGHGGGAPHGGGHAPHAAPPHGGGHAPAAPHGGSAAPHAPAGPKGHKGPGKGGGGGGGGKGGGGGGGHPHGHGPGGWWGGKWWGAGWWGPGWWGPGWWGPGWIGPGWWNSGYGDIYINTTVAGQTCDTWSEPLAACSGANFQPCITQALLDAAYTALSANNMQPVVQQFTDGKVYLYSFEDNKIFIRLCTHFSTGTVGAQGATTMHTYRVQAGQTPMQIAVAFTGDPNRATELVRANPGKPAMWVGNILTFRSLNAGEVLNLPASWHVRGVGDGDIGGPGTGGQHFGDLPMRGIMTMPMAGGSQVFGLGQSVGAAVVIDATTADNACTSTAGPGGDGFQSAVPPADVQQALNPNGIGAGSWTGGEVFALYKGSIYRFSNPMGYAKCAGVDPAKLPGGTTAKPIAAAPGTSPWLIVGVGAGALLLGGLAAYFVTRKPKTAHEIAKEEEEARQFYLERTANQFYL